MKRILMTMGLGLALMMPVAANAASASPSEQRAAIQKMEANTLERLYVANPDTRKEVAQSVGYAVFSSGSLSVIWVTGGYGHGVAHSNDSNRDTYMQMATAGVGLGIGAKDYNTVFVFHDRKAMEDFVTTGLDMSAHGDAAAKVGAKGDAVSGAKDVLPGVNIYQMTDSGLLAQVMLQGTKYWRDDELNDTQSGMNAPATEKKSYN